MANENIIPGEQPMAPAGEQPIVPPAGEQPIVPSTGEQPIVPPVDPNIQTQEMGEQEMRSDIDRKLADAESQNSAIESKKIIAKNKIKEFKVTMLRDIYAMIQELGVDPNDPESIKNFLLSIEQQDPDLLILFETIFDTLSPDSQSSIDSLSEPAGQVPAEQVPAEQMPAEQVPAEQMPAEQMPAELIPGQPTVPQAPTNGQNLMNKYNNLQEGILR